MNAHYWMRRLSRRATCVLAPGVRLYPSARIYNARGVSSVIQIGANSLIRGELFVFAHGGQIIVGESCYIGEGSRIWSAGLIEIQDRVMISHNVNVFDNLTHPVSPTARHQQFVDIATKGHPKEISLGERPVRINADALIGASSTILRGVTVGRGAIVGAGSVVTKDVAPFSIVAGNPAKLVRELTEEERQ